MPYGLERVKRKLPNLLRLDVPDWDAHSLGLLDFSGDNLKFRVG